MTRMDCDQLLDAASELALGILPGDERAAAVAHLEGCLSCQQQVSALATMTEQLLLLAPTAEPSAGFEQRVLAALTPTVTTPRRPRVRRRRVAVAGLAMAMA